MGKKKILQERQISCPKEVEIKDFSGLKKWDPKKELLNKSFIFEAIKECLMDGDPEGAVEVLMIYLRAVNRRKLARDTGVSRSTIEHGLKRGNTTIKTAFTLLSA